MAIGPVHDVSFAQRPAALWIFALEQVPATSARAQHFAVGRNLETFRHGLACFNAFGTAHRICPLKKERAI